MSANLCNLITIPLKTTPSNRNLEKQCKLMTLNAQSVKKKDTLIMDNITENKVYESVVTETWLKEQDNIWISNSEFKEITISLRWQTEIKDKEEDWP